MVLQDKNLFAQQLSNLLLSETSIGRQLENHGRIKKVLKKTSQNNLKVFLFLLKPLQFSKCLSINALIHHPLFNKVIFLNEWSVGIVQR